MKAGKRRLSVLGIFGTCQSRAVLALNCNFESAYAHVHQAAEVTADTRRLLGHGVSTGCRPGLPAGVSG